MNMVLQLIALEEVVLGMLAYYYSPFLIQSNRRAIDWKHCRYRFYTASVIAIRMFLKSPFGTISFFEQIGRIFVSILEFSRAGK